MAASHQLAVAHTTLGILGNVANFIFFLSSAPTVLKIVRNKSTGGLSGDLYILKLFNCMLWSFYGLPFIHPNDFWVVLTNTIGCVFAILYIIPYCYYAEKAERAKMLWELASIVSSFTIMVVLLLLLDHSQTHRIFIVGLLSAIVSSGMHMTLLSQLNVAIQSKDMKYLYPHASLAAFIKGSIWTTYGAVNFDIFIVVPNAVGVLIGVIQVFLFLFLHMVSVKDREQKNTSTEEKVSKRFSIDMALDNVIIVQEGDFVEQPQINTTQSASVSRVSSLLGVPRQPNMSSIVVPIVVDDMDTFPATKP